MLSEIQRAALKLKSVVTHTPLMASVGLSEQYQANILLKREDLQVVRSYKLRGAYNKISNLSQAQLQNGVVCASAGNHAQGVAYSCQKLGIKGTIFMPVPTPKQKVNQVKLFGKQFVEVVLVGDTFDDAYAEAQAFCKIQKAEFIHPFDDDAIIAGQGTVGLEILNDCQTPIDYLLVPIGGGGLIAGLLTVFSALSPHTKIIGIEPEGAPAMKTALAQKEVITLHKIDKFVDGAAVKTVGERNFNIAQNHLTNDVYLVNEGAVCAMILKLYDEEGMVVEPAGALSVAVLDDIRTEIKGKTVVCIISGGNNDITRTEEIRERAMLYQGLKHYFIIRFPQRPGALKAFVNQVLGVNDDISYFSYTKKDNKEKGPVVLGIELADHTDFESLTQRMKSLGFEYEYLNEKPDLMRYLV
jgi:threonine dehydratase